jgi:hypothetical protein
MVGRLTGGIAGNFLDFNDGWMVFWRCILLFLSAPSLELAGNGYLDYGYGDTGM